MSQLLCKDLSLGYDGKIIIKNINFNVEAGDYLCITGSNGSGKTTLIKALLGINTTAVSGCIEYGEGVFNGNIGYLPQQTDVQRDFPASVREIVISGCLNKCGGILYGKKEKEKELAASSMEKLGISQLADRSYRKLSGGQQQRVLLARALCSAGKMILLDEPVSGLDPHAAAEMYDTVGKLNRDGITVVMVSHDVPSILKYSTHILHLCKTPFFGTKEECIKKGVLGGGIL